MNTEIVPVTTEDREISTSDIRTILENPWASKLILFEQLNRVEELVSQHILSCCSGIPNAIDQG